MSDAILRLLNSPIGDDAALGTSRVRFIEGRRHRQSRRFQVCLHSAFLGLSVSVGFPVTQTQCHITQIDIPA